jgi:Zn-dependent M28 family amino/carboxypeptidase
MVYVIAILFILVLCLAIPWRLMVWMPGTSFRGTAPPLDEQEEKIRDLLEQELTILGQEIGERNVSHRYNELIDAALFIERSLQESGYEIRRQEFTVNERAVWNIDVQRTGNRHPDEIVIVGAHYDTVPGSPGANDNGSAVVANLALARSLADATPERTIRFAFFVNEEFPYYMTEDMGSLRYAEQCHASDERVVAMICLEMVGCFLDNPDTQRYPVALLRHLYPTTGNFVAVVGNVRSRRLVHRVIRQFRRTKFPSEGIAAPRWLKDIFRSDHAAFWSHGYPAVMITDTANFRYRHYHTAEDTPDKINYIAMARVVTALRNSLSDLAGTGR